MKILCKFFEHKYEFVKDTQNLRKKCKRCGHEQIRMQERWPNYVWVDDPVEKFIGMKLP